MARLPLSPFLNNGLTIAVFQSLGTVPVSKDNRKIAVTSGAISFDSSFRTIGLMASGPAALEGFSPLKSLRTPLSDSTISGIVGTLDLNESGNNKSRPDDIPSSKTPWQSLTRSKADLDEKTDLNCLFRALALSTLEVTVDSPSLRGPIP